MHPRKLVNFIICLNDRYPLQWFSLIIYVRVELRLQSSSAKKKGNKAPKIIKRHISMAASLRNSPNPVPEDGIQKLYCFYET